MPAQADGWIRTQGRVKKDGSKRLCELLCSIIAFPVTELYSPRVQNIKTPASTVMQDDHRFWRSSEKEVTASKAM